MGVGSGCTVVHCGAVVAGRGEVVGVGKKRKAPSGFVLVGSYRAVAARYMALSCCGSCCNKHYSRQKLSVVFVFS